MTVHSPAEGPKRYVLLERPLQRVTVGDRVIRVLSLPEVGAGGMDITLLVDKIYELHQVRTVIA